MSETTDHKRPLWVDVTILILAGAALITMILLGNWQVKRLAWKLDLIEQVETRAFGEPVQIQLDQDLPEYLRVKTSGVFLHDSSVQVKALTELGAGSWVFTPLQTAEGLLWVNRGFVPSGTSTSEWNNPTDRVAINGLVRLSVPNGTALEKNDPSANRWVSPDVAALTASAKLAETAGFYVAADHIGPPQAWPRGGLTKTEFRNSHLSYALTWYAMAFLFLLAMAYVIWERLYRGR